MVICEICAAWSSYYTYTHQPIHNNTRRQKSNIEDPQTTNNAAHKPNHTPSSKMATDKDPAPTSSRPSTRSQTACNPTTQPTASARSQTRARTRSIGSRPHPSRAWRPLAAGRRGRGSSSGRRLGPRGRGSGSVAWSGCRRGGRVRGGMGWRRRGCGAGISSVVLGMLGRGGLPCLGTVACWWRRGWVARLKGALRLGMLGLSVCASKARCYWYWCCRCRCRSRSHRKWPGLVRAIVQCRCRPARQMDSDGWSTAAGRPSASEVGLPRGDTSGGSPLRSGLATCSGFGSQRESQ